MFMQMKHRGSRGPSRFEPPYPKKGDPNYKEYIKWRNTLILLCSLGFITLFGGLPLLAWMNVRESNKRALNHECCEYYRVEKPDCYLPGCLP